MNDTKAQTIATYDASAKAMAEKFDRVGARTEDIQRIMQYVHAKNPRILEFGCGNGRDAQALMAFTNAYLGIDASVELLKIARSTVPDAHFELVDFETYDLAARTDLLFASAALLHSPKEKIAHILRAAHVALSESGLVFLSLKEGTYQEETISDAHGNRTFYYYTPELIQELAGEGYQTLFIERQRIREKTWFTILLQKISDH